MADYGDDSMRNFVLKLPKVELHAHLNGSFSRETLMKLNTLKNELTDTNLSCSSFGSLSECFQIFQLVHKLIDNLSALYMATKDVIKEFYDDGVRYLELRTTPKELPGNVSRCQYTQTVTRAIQDMKCLLPDMIIKLLLSIDRKNCSFTTAEEIVKLAIEESKVNSVVVGIDLSGDPHTDDVSKFIPLLKSAKKEGLKLALHLAEIPGADNEVEELLLINPDRIGHGTFIHCNKGGSKKNFDTVLEKRVPLEICLTSNVLSHTVPSYEDHHFPLWKEINFPCVLCTDDKGIFNTTLSEEYYLAQKYYNVTDRELWELSYNAIDYSFANIDEKSQLQKLWITRKNCLFSDKDELKTLSEKKK